jgi:hypothetical protein
VIRRRDFHRAVFVTAGVYNIAFGVFAALDPQWLFRFAGLPPLNHPAVFACLGMVVGLLGKLLDPLGLVVLIWRGTWPVAAGVLCLFNDLVWWIPFALYLYDARPWRPRAAA